VTILEGILHPCSSPGTRCRTCPIGRGLLEGGDLGFGEQNADLPYLRFECLAAEAFSIRGRTYSLLYRDPLLLFDGVDKGVDSGRWELVPVRRLMRAPRRTRHYR